MLPVAIVRSLEGHVYVMLIDYWVKIRETVQCVLQSTGKTGLLVSEIESRCESCYAGFVVLCIFVAFRDQETKLAHSGCVL